MKRLTILLVLLLSGTGYSFAYVVSGALTNTSSQPVVGHTVHVFIDSGANTGYSYTLTTNSNGRYEVQIPTAVPSGKTVIVTTEDCNATTLSQTVIYQMASLSVNFTLCVPATQNRISGRITRGANTNESAYPATVFFIARYNDSQNITHLALLDTAKTNATGEYGKNVSFSADHYQGYSSRLLVKAALDSGANHYAEFLPTYYTSLLQWSGAATVTSLPAAVNIGLIAGVNPGGPAFVGGSVLQGANRPTGVGDPLAQRILLLTDALDNPLAYTYSDAGGHFQFSNLAYGTYKLFGDVWGKQNPALQFTLDAGTPAITDIYFEENSTIFQGHLRTTAVAGVSTGNVLQVYPNPATDILYINGLDQIPGNKYIVLTDVRGAQVYRSETATDARLSIPVGTLSKGIYLLKVQSAAGSLLVKVTCY